VGPDSSSFGDAGTASRGVEGLVGSWTPKHRASSSGGTPSPGEMTSYVSGSMVLVITSVWDSCWGMQGDGGGVTSQVPRIVWEELGQQQTGWGWGWGMGLWEAEQLSLRMCTESFLHMLCTAS
jgi:hypothetical protein